jgi:hypothetical protein
MGHGHLRQCWFENLTTVSSPLSVENEQSTVLIMIKDLNNMLSLELSCSVSFDRQLNADDEVFEDDTRTRLIVVGASHL